MKTDKAKRSAMLVSVTIVNGGLLGERKKREATEFVENTYSVKPKRSKTSAYLIDRQAKPVKRVIAASQRVREVLYKYTNPWGDDKTRVLVASLYDIYNLKINEAIAELKDAWKVYADAYPRLVAESQPDLGGLYDATEYPPADKILSLFRVSATAWPFPQSGHFVAEIANEAAEEAKQAIEAEVERRLLESSSDLVSRAKEVVSNFVDRLEAFKKKDAESGAKSFRDSLVDNIKETAELIEQMNITENTQIAKLVTSLRRLSGFSTYHLRRHEDTRAKAISAGEDLLTTIAMLDLKDQEVSTMVADAGDYMDM